MQSPKHVTKNQTILKSNIATNITLGHTEPGTHSAQLTKKNTEVLDYGSGGVKSKLFSHSSQLAGNPVQQNMLSKTAYGAFPGGKLVSDGFSQTSNKKISALSNKNEEGTSIN